MLIQDIFTRVQAVGDDPAGNVVLAIGRDLTAPDIMRAPTRGTFAVMSCTSGFTRLEIPVMGAGFAPPTRPAPTPETPLQRHLLIAGWAFLIVAMAYGTGKAEMGMKTRWSLLGIKTIGGGLLTLEILNPGSISTYLGQALGASAQELLPLAGLAAIGILIYSVYAWWRKRLTEASTPNTQVAFNLRGNN